MSQSKPLTLKVLEEECKDFPHIKPLGKGLYKIQPIGIICGETFLRTLEQSIHKQTNF